MPSTPTSPGLYELLLTKAHAAIADRPDAEVSPLSGPQAARIISRHLADYLSRALDSIDDDARPDLQVAIANRLLDTLHTLLPDFAATDDAIIARVLHALAVPAHTARPELALSESGLYINAQRERRLGLALEREFASADKVDLICAFLGWDGYRALRPAIEAHLENRPLRVLTTTYRGITDPRVLDELTALGAEVRVSYRTDATRLHAKAWLFVRDSGFSTAYIGSSNLSRSALTSGLEWNVRLSQIENPHLIKEFQAAFDTYWLNPEFEPYDPARFALELHSERKDHTSLSVFELRPRPFQQEILERLDAERALHDRHRNLVVAATGTGKTVIAALDYQRLCASQKSRPTLLFVAHRREILAQSLDTFRHATSDPSFGERFVDGHRPALWTHVFASVQSLATEDIAAWPKDRYDVIIIDEFHHAQGETYQRLLRHLAPHELLGLTATPERSDGAPILQWFSDRIAAELRLWDAIDRGLLVPFHYFAVHDVAALTTIRWTRGRFDRQALDNLYTGHHARAHLIVKAVRDHVADPARMRALAFCVGVDHAHFMADAFNRAGLTAATVTGDTPSQERERNLIRLRNGELQCLCTVDVFNEGVDLPEVDTVLFLRPTESATLFLQQLGRGLRRHPSKRCLTVLDFVAETHREFRYDLRFRALLGGEVGRSTLQKHIESGFPHLPSGCVIALDRVSREVILDNVSRSLRVDRRSLVAELKALGPVDLDTFLRESNLDLSDLYRNGRTFTELSRAAGFPLPPAGPPDEESQLARGVGRLIHLDDRLRLNAFSRFVAADTRPSPHSLNTAEARLRLMFSVALFGESIPDHDRAMLDRHPALVSELAALLRLLDTRLDHTILPFRFAREIPLQVHATYRLAEIMAALGDVRSNRIYLPREGEYFHVPSGCNLLFITLQKDEDDYSAATLYRDYALSPTRFHWQSQNATRPTDKKGQRHLHHRQQGVTPLLFVRSHKRDDRGDTLPYTFLGPANLDAHSGERPINIEWELEHPMPAFVLRKSAIVA